MYALSNNAPQSTSRLDALKEAFPCDQGLVRADFLTNEDTGEITVRISVTGFDLDAEVQQPQVVKTAYTFGGIRKDLVTDLDSTGATFHFQEGRTDDLETCALQVLGIRREVAKKLNSIYRQRMGVARQPQARWSPYHTPNEVADRQRRERIHGPELAEFANFIGF